MTTIAKWTPLTIALLLNAVANILIKIGSKTAPPLPPEASVGSRLAGFLNLATVAGMLLFAANLLAYRKALDHLDISVAYPIMVSAGMVLVTLAAWALPVLSERIGPARIAGMGLIAVGVWLVAGGAETLMKGRS